MKKRRSIRLLILIPVLLLGAVSIVSNILALFNLSKVNNTASKIADEYMVAITELDTIGQTSKDIHTLALSHIVATDFETMTSVIADIESEEAVLDETIAAYSKFTTASNQEYYEKMQQDYKTFQDSIKVLLAQSANQKTKDAYTTANGEVADSANLLSEDIDAIIASFNEDVNVARSDLAAANMFASYVSLAVIIVSLIAVAIATFIVLRYVIHPVIRAKDELQDIIDGINRREGDLTRRITVESDDEIGALSSGINSFIELLQDIFTMITNNSTSMFKVVGDVMGSVQTSNSSASDLSALTEELSATMQEVANSAGTINNNTETVREEVEEMAKKSHEINEYSRTMKAHADTMEQSARANMNETNAKVEKILVALNEAIEDSKSVDQVNSLTDEILNIADQTNLLSLNASIEAARAGEAGKGFAVVASEIGSLALDSSQTASNIQEINSIVVNAVHNLSDNANELVAYLKEYILPEFEKFCEDGAKYKDNADYVESVMNDFSNKTEGFKSTFEDIAGSINSITTAIDEGVKGVSSAAESTQTLVNDMDNIAKRMDENQKIAGELDNETKIFSKM
ncbi:Methyl-accepting chemotaxis protein [Butyrivibrio fibrisolvens DSM 3071]|jgi:methyl-accepting chemotaxis protein|uniref:Methyl-accepting chemotaxis protein n=1 Tax=Butyrivibrio fibrisolvens DSM 3071 TaxID=1121131 RepID=A0A1M5ZDE3_BUTFI|nr:methyl-accepting chemotaxis protein [Butyrivibrio fibrisolvens]SHI22218.1 Methyl-accepting chemotaxis protein [Butyrivibrio fibrisolvens DSM 3071]